MYINTFLAFLQHIIRNIRFTLYCRCGKTPLSLAFAQTKGGFSMSAKILFFLLLCILSVNILLKTLTVFIQIRYQNLHADT